MKENIKKEICDKYNSAEHSAALWIYKRYGVVCSPRCLSSKVFCSEIS